MEWTQILKKNIDKVHENIFNHTFKFPGEFKGSFFILIVLIWQFWNEWIQLRIIFKICMKQYFRHFWKLLKQIFIVLRVLVADHINSFTFWIAVRVINFEVLEKTYFLYIRWAKFLRNIRYLYFFSYCCSIFLLYISKKMNKSLMDVIFSAKRQHINSLTWGRVGSNPIPWPQN